MPTILHERRKVLRQDISRHAYAEIADFLYFRTNNSKYINKEGKSFFLLPSVKYIADNLGYSTSTCKRALDFLSGNGYISKSKARCHDGAVRLKIQMCKYFDNYVPTIFHEGRKLMRQFISNHTYADIADFIYYKANNSRYINKEGKSFFLLPSVDFLSENLGFKRRTIERALKYLEKNDFLIKLRTRCHDGAVRLQIFVTEKLSDIMLSIEELRVLNPPVENKINTQVEDCSSDYDILAQSDSAKLTLSDSAIVTNSIIKENKVKEDNNYNNNQELEVIEKSKSPEVKSVNFVFSFDLDKYNEDVESYVSDLANKHNLDGSQLFSSLVELQESNIYKNQDDLVHDAISLLKHEKDDRVIAKGDDRRKYKKAIFEAGDSRGQILSPVQHVAVVQTLRWLKETGKSCISDVKEVFAWVEFQITNPDHHFKGKGFKHCLYIIKKMLCNSGRNQYSKPLGFGV